MGPERDAPTGKTRGLQFQGLVFMGFDLDGDHHLVAHLQLPGLGEVDEEVGLDVLAAVGGVLTSNHNLAGCGNGAYLHRFLDDLYHAASLAFCLTPSTTAAATSIFVCS